MSNELIQSEYEQLEALKNKFWRVSNDASQMRNILVQRMRVLEQAGWWGRGSEAFYNEMYSETLPALSRLIEALEEGSRVTKQIGEIFEQAEQEGKDGFQVLV